MYRQTVKFVSLKLILIYQIADTFWGRAGQSEQKGWGQPAQYQYMKRDPSKWTFCMA